MRTSAVQITEDGKLEHCETDSALAGARAGSGTFWIRIGDYQKEELDAWLDELSLSAFARKRVLNQGEMTKIVPLSKTMAEQIKHIKSWAHDRAIHASKI